VVNAIDKRRTAHSFVLLAYVIMPEHVHLVLWPPEAMALGTVVGEIKRCAAKETLSHLSKADGQVLDRLTVRRDSAERRVLWQRRCYDHNCRSETSVWEKVEYCHQNPVKRRLVHKAEDWEWSSYRWYKGDRDVPLQMDMAARQK
jgi:putative transposase